MLSALLLSAFLPSASASELVGFSLLNPALDEAWDPEDETCEIIEVSDEVLEYLGLVVLANEALAELCAELTDDGEVCVTSLDDLAAIQDEHISNDGDDEGPVAGFSLDIEPGSDGTAWKGCTEGAPDASVSTFGHKYVDEITLRGPLTSGREALCQWITEVIQGKEWRRAVVLAEVDKDGESSAFTFLDCFPSALVLPSLKGGDDEYEEVTLKPVRLSLS